MTRSLGLSVLFLGLFVASRLPSGLSIDAVPVLLWGGDPKFYTETSPVNPFQKTSGSEFREMVRSRMGKKLPPIIVFVKDDLCVEDFTIHKKHLQQATSDGHLSYFPAVEKPLEVFEDFASYNLTYDEDVDSLVDGQLAIRSIVNLEVVPETYKTLKESAPNLMAALTGRSCSYRISEREKREASSVAAGSNSTAFYIKSDRVLLYSKKAPLLKVAEDKDFVPIPQPTISDSGEGTQSSPLVLRMVFTGSDESVAKYALEFKYEVLTAGYYSLKTINYKKNDIEDNLLTTKRDIYFPFNFSYHCSNNITFQKGPVVLKIEDIQMQIDSNNFNDAYDCVGFTSIPIWTGIFVTAILALIMIWALTMIMDIRTMDRFDDPKGKTITISALE